MNKNTFLFLYFCITSICVHAQTALQSETTLPREGDKIVKQELGYKSPGGSGESVVWDFSELSSSGSNYTENYLGRLDSVLLCSGKENIYKYRLEGDSLLCIGYQNPTLQINYLLPELQQRFPANYQDSIHSYYYGEGVYSQTLPIIVYGETTHVIDGKGKLLFPGGDSLQNVLRVRSHAHIGQKMSPFPTIYSQGDSSRYTIDSLSHWLATDRTTWEVEAYKWYAPGYRYPVFETIRTYIVRPSGKTKHFSRSFYFPVSEQNFLTEDMPNQVIRTMQNNQENERSLAKYHPTTPSQKTNANKPNYSFDYLIDANRELQIRYRLNEAATVSFYLHSSNGYTLWNNPSSNLSPGTYAAHYDLSSLPAGTYLLTFRINTDTRTEKIQIK